MSGISSSGLFLVLSAAVRNLNRRGDRADPEDQVTAVMGALRLPRRTSNATLAVELRERGCDIDPELFVVSARPSLRSGDMEGEVSPLRQLALALLQLLSRAEVAEEFGLECQVHASLHQTESQGV